MQAQNSTSGSSEALAQAVQQSERTKYVLRLYVAGNTKKSTQAVLALRRLCDQYLAGRYQLDVVDIYQNPSATRENQIIATPTLVKSEPKPMRKIIGDLARMDHVLAGLGLAPSALSAN